MRIFIRYLLLCAIVLTLGGCGTKEDITDPSTASSLLTENEKKEARELLKDQWDEISASWAPYSGYWDIKLTEADLRLDESFKTFMGGSVPTEARDFIGKNLTGSLQYPVYYHLKVAPGMYYVAKKSVPGDSMKIESTEIIGASQDTEGVEAVRKIAEEQIPGFTGNLIYLQEGSMWVLAQNQTGEEYLMGFDPFVKEFGIDAYTFYPRDEFLDATARYYEYWDEVNRKTIEENTTVIRVGENTYYFHGYGGFEHVKNLPEGYSMGGYITAEMCVKNPSEEYLGLAYYVNPKEPEGIYVRMMTGDPEHPGEKVYEYFRWPVKE